MLGLIADDLTGAADASVQFARRGWDTFLSLDQTSVVPGFSRANERVVIAVTTDCRALANDAAETLTADALTALMAQGVDRVFVKIDSTMRGSVPGQVAGALSAWRKTYADARAVVCPAYPQMGRTVESKRLLVHGEPVERTAIGRDPVTPVKTSEMAELLPSSPGVTVPDAATDADLRQIGESIAASGASTVAVGSGGLAGALAEVWVDAIGPANRLRPGYGGQEAGQYEVHVPRRARLKPGETRILLQISSLNPVSRAQVARLEKAFPDVAVLSAPSEPGDSAIVAERLAGEFANRFEREQWDLLGLIGGDGARATLRRLGASGIRIVDSLVEGIPLGIVVGGRADGTPVFTKAGGFGGEDVLVRCIERMKA